MRKLCNPIWIGKVLALKLNIRIFTCKNFHPSSFICKHVLRKKHQIGKIRNHKMVSSDRRLPEAHHSSLSGTVIFVSEIYIYIYISAVSSTQVAAIWFVCGRFYNYFNDIWTLSTYIKIEWIPDLLTHLLNDKIMWHLFCKTPMLAGCVF